MPDFGKALKQMRALKATGAASNRSFSLTDQLQYLKSRLTTAFTEVLPPGQVESTSLGSHYVIHAIYPADHFHGRIRLSRLSSAELDCLMTLMREKGIVPDRDGIVFLDTETTGIQGGAGMCPF